MMEVFSHRMNTAPPAHVITLLELGICMWLEISRSPVVIHVEILSDRKDLQRKDRPPALSRDHIFIGTIKGSK